MQKQVLSFMLAMLMCLSMAVPVAAKKAAAEIKLESVCDAIYDEIGDFHDGYAPAKKNGKWGVIDEKGKLVVKAKYDWMADVHEDVVVVALYNEKDYYYHMYLVNMSGKETALQRYNLSLKKNYDLLMTKDDLASKDASRWGCHDGIVRIAQYLYQPDGTEIRCPLIEQEYSDVISDYWAVKCHGDNGVVLMYARVKSGGSTYFLMDVPNKRVTWIKTPKWDDDVVSVSYVSYSDGLMGVELKKNVTQGEYEYCVGIADAEGNWVVTPDYKTFRVDGYTQSFVFDDTITLVQKDGKHGVVDLKGDIVLPFEYDSLGAFHDGMATAEKNGKAGYVDKKGQFYEVKGTDGKTLNISLYGSFYKDAAVVIGGEPLTCWIARQNEETHTIEVVPGTNKLAPMLFFPYMDESTDRRTALRTAEELLSGVFGTKYENGKWGLVRLVERKPAPETTTPVTTVPAPETTAPAPETTAPAPVTTAPTPETTVPAPETTAPAPETTAPAPETAAPGTPIGDVLYTDIVAYIDDKPIRSYNIAGNTYIVVEDLAAYGFDVQWIAEGSGKLVVGTTRTAAPDGYTTTYVPEKNTHPAGSVAMQYLYTNITAWLGDAQVTGYNIGGFTCIGMDDLANTFATNYVWDGVEGALRLYTQP